VKCSNELCKCAINFITNPNPVYRHTYHKTGSSVVSRWVSSPVYDQVASTMLNHKRLMNARKDGHMQLVKRAPNTVDPRCEFLMAVNIKIVSSGM
jgi:hypothetical protein